MLENNYQFILGTHVYSFKCTNGVHYQVVFTESMDNNGRYEIVIQDLLNQNKKFDPMFRRRMMLIVSDFLIKFPDCDIQMNVNMSKDKATVKFRKFMRWIAYSSLPLKVKEIDFSVIDQRYLYTNVVFGLN